MAFWDCCCCCFGVVFAPSFRDNNKSICGTQARVCRFLVVKNLTTSQGSKGREAANTTAGPKVTIVEKAYRTSTLKTVKYGLK